MRLPNEISGKNLPARAGDTIQSLDQVDPLGEGNGSHSINSCFGNPMLRGTWWATVHGTLKSQIQLSDLACLSIYSI